MRIQPSALVFAVLVLVIGALLLASNSMDPKAGVRAQISPTLPASTAQPTALSVDRWGYSKFVPWKSQDSLIQTEHPDTWLAQQDPQQRLAYVIASPVSQGESIKIQMIPVVALNFQNSPANAAPADMLKQYLARPQVNQANAPIQPAEAGGLKGSRTHWTVTVQDPNRGTIGVDTELWFLSLDPKYLLVIVSGTINADWPKMQPIFDHVVSTLKVDQAGAVKIMDTLMAGAATAPAAQPGAAGPSATQAATKAATSAK